MRRTVAMTLGALVVAMVLVACGGSDAGSTTGGGATTGGGTATGGGAQTGGGTGGAVDISQMASVRIRTEGFSFAPAELSGSPGQTLTVEVENEGGVAHTFTIRDLGIDEELEPGERVDVEVTLPEDGSLPFVCRFHERSGMVGEFTVS